MIGMHTVVLWGMSNLSYSEKRAQLLTVYLVFVFILLFALLIFSPVAPIGRAGQCP